MNLIFRLILTIIAAFRGPKQEALDLYETTYRVLPSDLDSNIHLTNARYLSIMDLGRVDLIIRSGFLTEMRARKWYPVVGESHLVHRRSLAPFERYALRTQILCWDEKWVYLAQDFIRNGRDGEQLAARGIVKTLFLGPEGRVSTEELVKAFGHDGPTPEIPEEIIRRFGFTDEIKARQK